MIARRLPFDHEHIPTLLKMIKLGEYEMDSEIQRGEEEIVRGSLKRDVKVRWTVSRYSRFLVFHPGD